MIKFLILRPIVLLNHFLLIGKIGQRLAIHSLHLGHWLHLLNCSCLHCLLVNRWSDNLRCSNILGIPGGGRLDISPGWLHNWIDSLSIAVLKCRVGLLLEITICGSDSTDSIIAKILVSCCVGVPWTESHIRSVVSCSLSVSCNLALDCSSVVYDRLSPWSYCWASWGQSVPWDTESISMYLMFALLPEPPNVILGFMSYCLWK